MSIKLLIADVDGTLVTPSKTLTARTREAVARLRGAGVDFTITSGRPPRGMAMLVEPLGLTAPVAAFNGGVYLEPDLRTVLVQHTIASTVARRTVDYFLRAGLDVWVYRGTDWFIRDAGAPRVARERANVQFEPTVVDDIHAVLEGAVKIVGVSEDRALVARAEAEIGAHLGTDASAARSHAAYLDVTHPEANKGMVVREAARLLGIRLDEVATIGDMPNDISMISVAGHGIAMGNASPEVQRAARHVTLSNEDEGFAHAVDAFILGQPPLARTALGLPPRARACLFALEGVIVQTAPLQAGAWKRLLDHHLRRRAHAAGEPFIPFDAVRDWSRHFDGRSPLEGIGSFLAARGIELSDATLVALVARKDEVLAELLGRERVESYEGSVSYVKAARAAGLRTAVVAAGERGQRVLQAAGLADLFDEEVDAPPATDETPALDAYLAAARTLGVEPAQAALFADDGAGIEAGRAGHFGYLVRVDRPGRDGVPLRPGADVVVPDLAALLAPAGG